MSKDSFKVVLIGGPSVGKSAIFRRYMQGDFKDAAEVTMSASYMEKSVNVAGQGKPIKIQLWDTAGHDRFKSINRIYYRDAAAALIVYDVTRRESLYQDAEHWIKDVKENAPSHVILALAGNKSDMYQNQEVSMSEGQKYQTNSGIPIYNECSAK